MSENVWCDHCKTENDLASLKRPKVEHFVVACPKGSHPTEHRKVTFSCPRCKKKTISSVRKALP